MAHCYETTECPACGPAAYKVWLDDGKPTRYLRCGVCATIFASPRLREIARILQPGGLLAIEVAGSSYSSVRNRGPLCLLIDGRWTRLRTDGVHLYWYSLAGLKGLAGQAGFRAVQWVPVPSPVPNGYSRYLAEAYNRTIPYLTSTWPGLLRWAPKYFSLFEKVKSC